ncbi:MAG: hypothetical protein NTW15_04005 [Burkholderiales bacterium]|nr:hypothetical protein [Burkholderiales bacterium]
MYDRQVVVVPRATPAWSVKVRPLASAGKPGQFAPVVAVRQFSGRMSFESAWWFTT